MEANKCIQKLNEISTKKLALMEELLLFTRSQKEMIQSGRFEEMDSLIDGKQLRMDAMDKLDAQFLESATKLKSLLSLRSFENLHRYKIPGTAELKEMVVKIHQTLLEIKSLDEENTALVKAELKETKEKIDHSNAFKRVTGAYYPVQNEIPSYYFDKKK